MKLDQFLIFNFESFSRLLADYSFVLFNAYAHSQAHVQYIRTDICRNYIISDIQLLRHFGQLID